MDLDKIGWKMSTELLSFKIGTSGGGVVPVKMVINLSVP
jgi:hypothetical protein